MHNHTADSTCHGTSYSGLTFSFLAGGLAGATVALLLAPQSGKATREMMGRKLNDTAESARDLKGCVVERLNDTADSVLAMKGRMVDKLNSAADSARQFKDRAFGQIQDIREEAAHGVEDAASALAGNGAHK